MASIRYDTELMMNHIAAVPVPAGSKFVAVLDPDSRRPAVISLSNNETPILELTQEDVNGHRQLVNLGEKLRLPSGKIQTFVAEQDANLQVYLAVSVASGDQASRLYVYKPFSLKALDAATMFPAQDVPTTKSLFMGPVTTPNAYPLLVAAIVPLGRGGDGSDLRRIVLDTSTTRVQALQTFHLPENADAILSIAVASHNKMGNGLWVLYRIQGTTKLVGEFARPGGDRSGLKYYYANPPCPIGASSVSSFIDSTGQTGLLIGASAGLHLLSAADGIAANVPAKLIAGDDIYKQPLNISVAQDGPALTIWSASNDGRLGYTCTSAAKIAQTLPVASVLMGHGSSTGFAPSISQPNTGTGTSVVTQHVISNDSFGNMTLLVQNRDTGVWRSEPFAVAASTECLEIKSYTFKISTLDEAKRPLRNGRLNVTASSDTTAYVNGRLYNIASGGSWIPVDATGETALIVPTATLSGRSLTITGVQDGQGKDIRMAASNVLIDPSIKAMSAFESITADTDLSKLTTKSGKSVWEGMAEKDKPSSDDLRSAAKCLAKMKEAKDDLAGPARSAMAMRVAAEPDKSLGDILMDGFNWVKEKLHEAWDWIVEKVNGVWRFVCTIAGEVKKFVLDCVEKVGEALTWVWQKIKLGIDMLIEFAGFIFDWDDIKTTKKSIESLINASLVYSGNALSGVERKVDSFFSDLQSKIDDRKSIGEQKATLDSGGKGPGSDATNSAALNHLPERMKNGGFGSGSSITSATAKRSDFNGDPTWEQVFAPLGDSFTKLATDLGDNITKLFDSTGSFTNGDLWEQLGKQFLSDALGVIKEIVLSILKLVQKLISAFRKLGNARINIPIITALWEKMGLGDLTVFGAVSFILGAMTCIMSKLITGRAPPRFDTVDESFFDSLVQGTIEDSRKTDLAMFGGCLIMNVTIVKGIVDVIQLLKTIATQGGGAATESLTEGGGVVFLFGTAVKVAGLISMLPTDTKVPGHEYRKWAIYMSLLATGADVLFTYTGIGGAESATKLEVFKLILQLVNFGLYEAVFVDELNEQSKYPGKDQTLSILGSVENVWTTLESCGKTLAYATAKEQPEIAAIGLGAMMGAGGALVVNKGATMHRSADLVVTTTRGVVNAP